jgi:hypothetical protein
MDGWMDIYDETKIHFSATSWKMSVKYFGIRIRKVSKLFTAVSSNPFTFKGTIHTGNKSKL